MDNGMDMATMMAMMNMFSGKSQPELMRELMMRGQTAKKEGTLTGSEIDEFISRAAPMMTTEQRKRLKQLTDMLR